MESGLTCFFLGDLCATVLTPYDFPQRFKAKDLKINLYVLSPTHFGILGYILQAMKAKVFFSSLLAKENSIICFKFYRMLKGI